MRFRLIAATLGLIGLAFSVSTGAADDRLPVSSGEYQIRLGGQRIGQEQFRVFKDKGYVIETTQTLYWPEPMRHEFRYELEPTLEPRKLELSTTRGGITTELKLERSGENWRVEVKGQGRDKKKYELGRRGGTVVDFDSLLFNGLALRRFALEPGGEKKVEAITMQLPDVAAGRSGQAYRRVDDEDVKTEFGGTVHAAVYELEAAGRTHRLWVAPSGIVVKAHFDRIAGEQESVLVRLNTPPGSWPP